MEPKARPAGPQSGSPGTDGGSAPPNPADGFADGPPPQMDWRGPVKRSVTIAGHETSVSLEPVFWAALRDAAFAESLPLNALIARIDAERIAHSNPPNLASAIRVWLFCRNASQ